MRDSQRRRHRLSIFVALNGQSQPARGLGIFSARNQSSFSPNCTCRAVVDVLVITPAVGETPEGVNTTSLGWLKIRTIEEVEDLGAKLKAHVLANPVASPGPISVSLPTFP
jgi:hypothetical protein